MGACIHQSEAEGILRDIDTYALQIRDFAAEWTPYDDAKTVENLKVVREQIKEVRDNLHVIRH